MDISGSERLGELLVRIGLITDEQLEHALNKQVAEGGRLGAVLVSDLIVSEHELARALAEQKDLALVNLAATEIDRSAARLLPLSVARMREIIPIGFEEGHLVLAMSDPLDIEAIDETHLRTGYPVTPVVAAASQVRYAIDKYLVAAYALDELDGYQIDSQPSAEDIAADGTPVVSAVNHLLRTAVLDRASDIHIEPTADKTRVRYRIDGVLQDVAHLPRASHYAVAARLKVLAELDITERRRPLDGRFAIRVDGMLIDVRLTTIPTRHGEGLVLRVLRADDSIRQIDEIGLLPHNRRALERMLLRAHGAILVSGPTGSGKTTTVYSIMQLLNSPERKLITIEDPIEYQIPGITQIGVNNAFGVTFASGLRSILRADPDVVMVGEIRDPETATIAVRAALTGHLVLSTLHANDAPATLTRLAELGVEPYLSSTAVLGAVAQRLVRRLCPECRRPQQIDAESLQALGFTAEEAETVTPYEPTGCEACRGTGFRGRVGLYEVLEMSEELNLLRQHRAPAEKLRRAALEAGMRTLRRDGLDKIAAGVTSIGEVLRETI